MSEWIDVSVPVYNGMVHWPDNPPVEIRRMLDMDRGDVCNVSTLSFGSHTGTHMDAPVHFISGGKGIDEMPLDATIGSARVIPISNREKILPEELIPQKIQSGERILFKTSNSSIAWKSSTFDENFVYLSKEAAQYLASLRIKIVGVDYLSVGGFKKDAADIHRYLLGAGIWIIEGLNLSGVEPGNYELVSLPIKIRGGDGAPARTILRKMEQ